MSNKHRDNISKKAPMVCDIVSAVLAIAFVIKSIADYTHYSTTLNSAPFYVWILVNVLYLVIPAIVVFIIGLIIKKKQ